MIDLLSSLFFSRGKLSFALPSCWRAIGWIFFQTLFAAHLLPSSLWNSITSKRIKLKTSGCSRFLANSQALWMRQRKLHWKHVELYLSRVVSSPTPHAWHSIICTPKIPKPLIFLNQASSHWWKTSLDQPTPTPSAPAKWLSSRKTALRDYLGHVWTLWKETWRTTRWILQLWISEHWKSYNILNTYMNISSPLPLANHPEKRWFLSP